jgi:transcriptional regulator with XRE-family HTH domain
METEKVEEEKGNQPTKRRALIDTEKIRRAIKGQGFSQKDFSQKIGVSPNFFGKLLNGTSALSADILLETALALKTPVENFISDKELNEHEYFFINSMNTGDNMTNNFNSSGAKLEEQNIKVLTLMEENMKLQKELIEAQKIIIKLQQKK